MGVFYNNYVKQCNIVGKSPSAVALDVGLSKTTVSGWKSGRTKPTDATAQRIADYFGVSVAYLLGEETEEKEKTPDNVGGLKATGYDKLTPENRAVIDDLIAKLVKGQSSQ